MDSKDKKRRKSPFAKLIHGLISGAADNDPAGISTYSIVGATTGLSQLWLVVISTPLLINVQSLCAKIGDVKKQGLAQIIKSTYGKKVALFSLIMLIIGNLATLGADFAAIAAGIRLIFPQLNTLFLLPLITIFIWYIIVFRSYHTFSKFLTLLSLVFTSYIIAGFLARPNWLQVIRATLVPQISNNPHYWLAAVAFLGTTITPFLFYWQVTEEVEDHPSVKDALHEVSQNTGGFIFSNTVTYFIIVTNASLFFNKGIKIENAVDAAAALTPLAGQFAKLLFAIGIVGSGLLAVPVLAAVTSYAVAETFGWKKGLNYSIRKAKSFYTTLSATFLIGLAIALIGLSPLKALFFSQVINGFLAPFLILIILMVANNPKVVGKYTASDWQNTLGWITVVIMSIAALGSIIQMN
jgi:Mn2+/Fe2+ NRAMP family transporter